MTKLVNRAKMTTATTGTGTISLASAVDGYQTFANAGVANADVVRYVIEDGDAWEIGLGTYSAGTLTRGSIESSNADSALNLTGNAVVYVTAAAADLQELVTFAESFVLPTADGSTGQVLTTNGAGTLTFSTVSGYTDADVDTHLNTGTAASGEVLSWTGTDYDWVTSGGAFSVVGTRNLAAIATLPALTTGTDNFAAGLAAGNSLTSSIDNILIGRSAGQSLTGSRNVTVGAESGLNLAGGLGNVAIGYQARASGNSAYAVSIGYLAGYNATGSDNIALGTRSLYGSTTLSGANNIGLGFETGYDLSTGTNNFFGGYRAGTNLTTGSNNVAIGNGALDAATTGGLNIAIGQNAMGLGVATVTGGNNIAIGQYAGNNINDGTSNVIVGDNAGKGISYGGSNVLLGSSAGSSMNGNRCIAIGLNALNVTTGNDNIGIATQAGQNLTTGTQNVFCGYQAGRFTTTGSFNLALGYLAGDLLTTGSNNIILGNGSDPSSATVSNEITLGNSSITTLRCQVTTITSLSDARDKTDIQPLNAGLDFVEALNPVSFTWNMRDGGKVGIADTGFIAQDLQAAQIKTGVAIPDLVYDVNPDKLEAGYGKLIPVLVQAIKDLSEKVKELEAKLEAN